MSLASMAPHRENALNVVCRQRSAGIPTVCACHSSRLSQRRSSGRISVSSMSTGERRMEWQVSPEVDASFREQRVAVLAEEPVRWKADASAFYFIGISSGVAATWMVDVKPDMRVVSGGPHRLTTMVEQNSGLTISRTGDVVAFGAASGNAQVWSFPLDAAGRITAARPEPLTPGEVAVVNPSLARDGATLVYSVERPGGTGGVELQKRTMSNGATETLRVSETASGEVRGQPHVSPDGKRVVFRYVPPESASRGRGGGTWGPQQMRLLDLNGKKESRLTSLADGAEVPFGWSSDSRFVVATFERRRYQPGQGGMAIGLFPVSAAPTADKQLSVVTTAGDEQTRLFQASMSPDRRWVTFLVQNVDGRARIAVVGPDVTWTTPRSESDWKYIDADQSRGQAPMVRRRPADLLPVGARRVMECVGRRIRPGDGPKRTTDAGHAFRRSRRADSLADRATRNQRRARAAGDPHDSSDRRHLDAEGESLTGPCCPRRS